MKFKTCDVLSVSTGFLLGDIDGVYRLMSFLAGRDLFTHELVIYHEAALAALLAVLPKLPTRENAAVVNERNYLEFLAKWESRIGHEIELDDVMHGCIGDGRNALDTLNAMVPPEKVIVCTVGKTP